jgi:hypothetical protein
MKKYLKYSLGILTGILIVLIVTVAILYATGFIKL